MMILLMEKMNMRFLMRSVYESRIRSLLTSLLDGWSYQDNHDVKSAKIINNIIYFM